MTRLCVPLIIFLESVNGLHKKNLTWQTDLNSPAIYLCIIVSVKGKRERWRRRKRKSEAGTVQDMLAVYKLLDSEMFPSLKAVMQVALTIPVSSCTCEWSFSALRRLHTWLRRTTGQSRLQHLAVMSIEKELLERIEHQRVIDRFATLKVRRHRLFGFFFCSWCEACIINYWWLILVYESSDRCATK